MQSTATSVEDYLSSLPAERRDMVEAIRRTILESLPAGYQEGMQYGMIGYAIPLSRHPDTYNGQPLAYAGLASQKNHVSVYLMGVYGDPAAEAWLQAAFAAAGKRLDMGKSCLRFRKLDDVPLGVIGEAVSRLPVEAFIERYEASRKRSRSARRS